MSAQTKTLFSGTALGLSGPLRVEILPNGMTARLTQPFRVRTGAGRIIEVPAGFETDFASVPRLFWRVVVVIAAPRPRAWRCVRCVHCATSTAGSPAARPHRRWSTG